MSGRRVAAASLVLTAALLLAGCTDPGDAPTPTDGTGSAETTAEESTTGSPTDEAGTTSPTTEDDTPTDQGSTTDAPSQEPVTEGAWTYATEGDLTSAVATAPGASLEFIEHRTTGRSASLRAEELTSEYLQDVLCPVSADQFGCPDLTAQLGGATLSVVVTAEGGDDDPRLSIADPLTLWDAIVAAEGAPLVLTATEPESGTEVVFEFATDGADPDLYSSDS